MSEPITKELRELPVMGNSVIECEDGKELERINLDNALVFATKADLDHIADRIDMAHKSRLDDCRHNTKRALVRYLRGVLTDYDRGIKRVRKGDATEVVRCRDCMYARRMDDRFVCTVRPLMAHLVDADDYCSRGVRAEVDE